MSENMKNDTRHPELDSGSNIPKLRFPEFVNGVKWEEEKLSEIYTFKVTNSFSRDKLNYDSGLVKNIHYGDIHTKFSTLFDIEKENVPFINSSISLEKTKDDCYCQESDMIFADASEDLEDVGKSIEIVNLNNEKLLSGLHTLQARQKESKFITGFGGYLFKSNKIRAQIKKESQGTKVLSISGTRLSNIDISYPKKKEEQQKIADCLSSADSLISAQSQKVELLKEHKKALMQQLFPQDGEEVPKLRFPEFKNAPKWEEKKLGDLLDYEQPTNYLVSDTNYNDSFEIPVLTAGKTFILGYTNETHGIFQNPLPVIIFDDFTTATQFVDFPFKAKSSAMKILKPKDDFGNIKIIFELMQTIEYQANEHKRYWISEYQNLEIKLPSPKEQQKIADFLSSIDEQIGSQTQKLQTLKEHKKALMQQLFPNNKETTNE